MQIYVQQEGQDERVYRDAETIAAVATALNDSGIGIVRVSGDESISIVNKIYRSAGKKCLTDYESHTINYGFIYDEEELIDEVMVSIFKLILIAHSFHSGANKNKIHIFHSDYP